MMFRTKIGFVPSNGESWNGGTWAEGMRDRCVAVLQTAFSIPHLPDFVQHELRLSGTTMYVPQDCREMIALMEGKRENVFKIMLRVNA
jgi:hypothetical protein